MSSDELWREFFQRRVAEMDVPKSRVAEVVAGAGARLRRRRRIRSAMPIVTVAAAAVTVAGIAGASHLLARPEAAPPSIAAAASPSVPSESAVVARLERQLSATGEVSLVNRSTTGTGGSAVWFRYRDRLGTAAVAIVIEREPTGTATDRSCAVPTCTIETRPDGSVLRTEKRATAGVAYQQWTAVLARRDGLVVTLMEFNSDQPKGTVTRAEPPLSITRLTTILLDISQ